MIRLLLDPQIFNEQKFGGISRYYTEIYSKLNEKEGVQINCPLLYTDNIHYKESPLFVNTYQQNNAFFIKYSKIFRSFSPRKLRKKNAKNLIELIKKQDFDVYIPTYYDTSFLEYIADKPFVLTVYDMIHELFPHYLSHDAAIIPNKKLLMEKATKIIAISESTKNDIIKLYPHIDSSKIEVIYLAHALKTETDIKLNLPKNYILFVGNRWIYKNFTFFLKAIASILKENPDLFLLCAGGNQFTTEEVQLINELNLTKQVIQQNFEDAELVYYYKNALCFVFPSEYEGFGIPVLEAMACGCPVVLANHSSFPEVAGNAGIYFELNNSSDLKNKVSALLKNEEKRKEYSLKGKKQAERFNWEKTTEECLKVYQKVI